MANQNQITETAVFFFQQFIKTFGNTDIEKFSQETGISKTKINAWLSKRYFPTVRELRLICDYFKCTSKSLLGY